MCFSRRLQQALKQELILKQCVNQSNLTVTLLQIRTDFKNDFEKKLTQINGKLNFGKTIQSKRKQRNIKLVTNEIKNRNKSVRNI